MLYLAAALMFVTGLAHSYLGERYLLQRLFKRDNLPKLLGDTAFTIGTLRFVWHLTTVAWWGLAVLVFIAAQNELTALRTLRVIAVVALVSGLFPLFYTRGRHLSWIVFFVVGALLWLASTQQ
jgi:hypothetical protein